MLASADEGASAVGKFYRIQNKKKLKDKDNERILRVFSCTFELFRELLPSHLKRVQLCCNVKDRALDFYRSTVLFNFLMLLIVI